MSGLDLSGADLTSAQLIGCNLTGTRLIRANLTGAVLHNADLSDVELLGSDVSGADFTSATATRAGFGQVVGREAVFLGVKASGTSFSEADLTGTDFHAADLSSTRMLNATLDDANLAGSNLGGVDLTGASLTGATLRDADLRGALLRNVTGFQSAEWIGTDIRDVDFTGAWHLRRHIQDENYIHEFRSQSRFHEVMYRLWWITSDCGRSLLRWSMWTVCVALVYAALYSRADVDWGAHQTPLSPVYYSVVTFTTLGYGDVLPGSAGAQLLAMSEVVLGYFSLGGMMSILSDKMARRAG